MRTLSPDNLSRRKDEIMLRGAFGLQWHITNKCDQRCRHCYIWRKQCLDGVKDEPDLTECRRIADDFCDFCRSIDCTPSMTITGGDPMLHPQFWEIMEYLAFRKIPLVILGNPFHLSLEKLQRLKELGVERFQLSIDGMEKTHDFFRKKGSFQATLKAIDLINQVGIKSMIMSTVSLVNYEEMPEVARLCVQNKVSNYAFARYCPTHGDSEHMMTAQQYRQFLADMWAVYTELAEGPTNFSLKDHLFTAYLYEEGLFHLRKEKNIIFEGCNCAVRHTCLLPNGDVYACRRFESPVGNIRSQSFRDLFFSKKMEDYRQFDQMEGCKDCELLCYCRGCHAVSAGLTGSFFDKDPQCWRC